MEIIDRDITIKFSEKEIKVIYQALINDICNNEYVYDLATMIEDFNKLFGLD